MFATTAPFQQYFDADGSPLDSGYIFIGTANQNPETSPIPVFWDDAGTLPAPQPLRTLNGYVMRNGTPATVYAATDYSTVVKSKSGAIVIYAPISTAGYKLNAVGSVGRTVNDRLTDQISAKDFGAKGDGITNDTAALQAAINGAQTLEKTLLIPGGTYIVTAPLNVTAAGVKIVGDGYYSTILKASGSFAAIMNFPVGASYTLVTDLSFITDGTSTRGVQLGVNSVVIRFSNCYFAGDLVGDLVYSNGQNLDISECSFQVNSANTYAINLDSYNQNTGITDCRIGGIGRGVRVTNALTPGSNRVEGLKIEDTYFINTGTTNVEIGTSLFTTISGSALDQATTHALDIGPSADGVVVDGCYIGSSVPAAAVGIFVQPAAGGNHVFSNNVFGFSGYGVSITASAGSRVNNVIISGNTFMSVANPLLLDSVNRCNIVGNIDANASVNGSWNTIATNASGGTYLFSANSWYTAPPALYHAASTYRFDNEVGVKGRNRGTNVPGGSTTSLVINHGLFRTPTTVIVTPEGAAGSYSIASLTATTFTVVWTTAGTPGWHWQAEV